MGRVEARTRPRANTCELISCEQVLSRYNINELRSIYSTACTAPVHLANRSPSTWLYDRFLSLRHALRSSLLRASSSANNQMKPLAYCRLRFVYDSSSWQHRSKFVDSYFSSSNEDDRFSSSYELFRDLGILVSNSAVESTLYFRVRLKLRAIEDE